MSTQITSVINKTFYPSLKKVMDSKSTAFKNLVGNFIKKNSIQLFDIAPCDRIYFLDEDVKELKKVVGENLFNECTKCINSTYYGNIPNFNPRAAKDEVTIILLCIIRYYIEKNDQKSLELALIYLSFSGKFYISIHSQFFKYLPNRNVMEYAINNLMSKKFDIVREGTVINAVKSISTKWADTYKNDIKTGTDEDVKDLIQQLRDRIKSFIKNISDVYYKAYENKDNYLAYDTDNLSQDSGNFRTTENNSGIMNKLTEASINYISTNSVNYAFVRRSSDTNVRFDELKMILETIQHSNTNILLVKELIGLIIVNYNNSTGNMDFRTIKFVSNSVSPKPNTKDKNVIRQREIIEQLLISCSERYSKRKSRIETKNSYHRSVLSYYVLIINYVAEKI